MPKEPRRRVLLALVTPEKPISEMTDDEISALADRLFDGMKSTLDRLAADDGPS